MPLIVALASALMASCATTSTETQTTTVLDAEQVPGGTSANPFAPSSGENQKNALFEQDVTAVARALYIPGKVFTIGPVRVAGQNEVVDLAKEPALAQLIAELRGCLIRMGAKVQPADRLLDLLEQHKKNLSDLFTSKGRATLGDFHPGEYIILGERTLDTVEFEVVNLQSAIAERAAIINITSENRDNAQSLLGNIRETLKNLRLFDRDESLKRFLRENPGKISLQELNSLLYLVREFDRSAVIEFAQEYKLLKTDNWQ